MKLVLEKALTTRIKKIIFPFMLIVRFKGNEIGFGNELGRQKLKRMYRGKRKRSIKSIGSFIYNNSYIG